MDMSCLLSDEEKERISKLDLDKPVLVVDEGFGPLKCPTCDRDVFFAYGEKCHICGQKLVFFR